MRVRQWGEEVFPEKKWPFTRANLEFAPDEPGVFVLWEGELPVYVGRVGDGSIKAQLIAHQDGQLGDCTMRATHYSWEITLWPAAREAELLAAFQRQHGAEPRCQRMSIKLA
jgi:hypothetical protein